MDWRRGNAPSQGSPLGSLRQAAEVASALDPGREAEVRLRLIAVLIAAIQTALAALDLHLGFSHQSYLLRLHLLQLGLSGAFFAFTFAPAFKRYWQWATLLYCLATLGAYALISIDRGIVGPFLVAAISIPVACAALVPWSGGWQTALNLAAIAAFIIYNIYSPPTDGLGANRTAGLLTMLLIAQAAVFMIQRDRGRLQALFAALSRSEERLRSVVESEPEAVLTIAADGRILDANPACRAMLLGEEPAPARTRIEDFAVAGSREELHNFVAHVCGGGRESLSFEAIARDGRQVWLECHAVALRQAPHEEPALLVVMRDVTASRQAESELRNRARQQAAVATLGLAALSRVELPALFEQTAELASQTLGLDLLRIMEYLPERSVLAVRASVGWRDGVGSEVRADAKSHAGYTMLAGESVIVADLAAEDRFETTALLRNHGVVSGIGVPIRGQHRPFGVLDAHSIRPRRFSTDDLNFLQGIANVLALAVEREHIERELAGARDAALDAVRLKTAFLTNISHEIRTPLNVIIGYNDLIASYLVERGDLSQQANLEAINRGTTRLLHTIQQILDLSRIESGGFEISPARVVLADIIGAVHRDFEPHAKDKGITITRQIEHEAAAIRFDEYCLSRALNSLIHNALKFTEQGEITIRLFRDPQGALCVEISDTGVGIDPDYLPRLYEPFSQEGTGYTRRFEGLGLGLTLSSKFLEMNGARLSARSEKGKGSVFTIHFTPDHEWPEPPAGDAAENATRSCETTARNGKP